MRCSHFNQNAYPPWTRQFSVTWKAWIAQSKQLDTCQHFQIQSSEYVLLSLSNISFTPCILSSFVLHILCLVAIQSQSVTAVWLLSINYQFSIYLNYFKASSWGNSQSLLWIFVFYVLSYYNITQLRKWNVCLGDWRASYPSSIVVQLCTTWRSSMPLRKLVWKQIDSAST